MGQFIGRFSTSTTWPVDFRPKDGDLQKLRATCAEKLAGQQQRQGAVGGGWSGMRMMCLNDSMTMKYQKRLCSSLCFSSVKKSIHLNEGNTLNLH